MFLFSLFLVNAKLNDYFTCPNFNSPNLTSNLETWRAGGTKASSLCFFHPTRYFKDNNCSCVQLYISGKCNKPAAHNVRQQKAKPSTTNSNPATEVFPTLFMCSQLCLRERFSKKKKKKKFYFFHAARSGHVNKCGPAVGGNFDSYLGKVSSIPDTQTEHYFLQCTEDCEITSWSNRYFCLQVNGR